MKIDRVFALYFSPTGNTRLAVCTVAHRLAGQLDAPCKEIDITLPAAHAESHTFQKGDLVVVGGPTYAGKLPNKMLPYYQEQLHGCGALAAAVVTYGNRSFDNSLAELCDVLQKNGFCTVGAGAFVGTHAFSDKLAPGRPAADDQQQMREFADTIAQKVQAAEETLAPVQPEGDAAAPYYVPKGLDGQPAKFLKAKPLTHADKCTGCGLCAQKCPMGSIDAADPAQVTGICIKCQACVRSCPHGAKYFEDAAFLSHIAMLEQNFTRRAENKLFL